MINKIVLFLSVVLLCVQTDELSAQGNQRRRGGREASDIHLTGHVVDAKTKEHLPFVNVAIKGTTMGAMTDATGHFYLPNVPKGNYTLVVSFVGYETQSREVKLETRKTYEVLFSLEEAAFALDEVVVSSNRNETKKREASTIVNVISPLMMERTGSTSMSDVLNYQSGLRVEFNCGNCGVPQLRINGLEGQYSQILLDSRPIFSSLASVYGLEQMPTDMVERVEVIRGGGSALFGSNAIGGVVNIITKEPLRNSVQASNQLQYIGGKALDNVTALNASFVTDDYKSGIYVFGVVKDRQGYDHNDDGYTDIPKLNSETLGFRGYHKLSRYSKLTAEYHHIREFRRGGDLLQRPPHEANVAEQLNHSINGGGVKYDLFSEDYKHRLNVYTSLQHINRDSYFGTDMNPDAYGKTTDLTLLAGAQYTYSFDQLWFMPADLTAGLEYNLNDLHDTMLGYNRVINQTAFTYGGYLQNEWKSTRWSILIGARLDKHSLVKNLVVSPRATVRYSPSQNVGLRMSYSSGYRAPQAYDEDLHVAAVGGKVTLIQLDPDLRPEFSHSVSASADWYLNFGQWDLNLLGEGFYTNINDVFALIENGHDEQGNTLMKRVNASGGFVAGVNLEAKASYRKKLLIDAGYTLQRSRYKEAFKWSNNPEIVPQTRMFRTPDIYGYLSVGYNFSKRFNATLTGNHTGSMLVKHYEGSEDPTEEREVETPHFFDLTARLSYDIPLSKTLSLEVSGGVKNALDSYQKDLDRGATKDSKYIYGPSLPRTFFLGLKIRM